MREKIMLGAAIVCLIATVGWSINRSRAQRLGASGNNGYTQEFKMPSPEMRKNMQAMMQKRPKVQPDITDPAQAEKMRDEIERQIDPAQREEFKKMGEEMRKRMEETRAALTPAESRQLMMKMREVFSRGGFPGGPRPGGPRSGGPPPAAK